MESIRSLRRCAERLFDVIDDAYTDHTFPLRVITERIGDLKETLSVGRYIRLLGPLGLLERHISEWHDLDEGSEREVIEWMVTWRIILGDCQHLLFRYLAPTGHVRGR